jgi:hypothetical protein
MNKKTPIPNEDLDWRCAFCGRPADLDLYVLRPEIWQKIGLDKGFCCLDCLPQRLGRELKLPDFNLHAPINRLIIFGYRMGRQADASEDMPDLPPYDGKAV